MKTIISDEPKKIIKFNRKLEKALDVKVMVKNERFHGSEGSDKQVKSGAGEVSIDGSPENEFLAEKVIDALNFGFPLDIALLIKSEDFLFEIINVKDYTHRKDLERIRARIIGRAGGTLRTLNSLTNCHFEMKNNEVAIIGSPEHIENAQKAVISIVQGSKQANVYSFLEKHHIEPVLDLGLKEENKGKKRKKG
jgi:KH domain-containing protein